MSRRRRLLAALGAGLLAGALPAAAQDSRRARRIAFLSLTSLTDPRIEAFRKGMGELGYVEGKTIAIDWRSADGDAQRLPLLAQELVRQQPEVLVAAQTQSIAAAKRATASIPIVFMATPDPVSSGFVSSLARPGGNLTGISTSASDVGPKQIELLAKVLPKLKRVAFFANPTNNASVAVRREVANAALKVNVEVLSLDAQDLGELERSMDDARNAGADAAFFAVDGFFIQVRERIAEMALRRKLPTMFTQREHVAAGGLMSYGPNVGAAYHRAAYYVHRILGGAKPAQIPVEQPTTFQLALNPKTAKSLGIELPRSVMVLADEVVN